MDAAHFVNKFGADIVRLWVSSVDYQNEVPFSEESFTRLGEAYRSFRNILRILLANLSGFEEGKQESKTASPDADRQSSRGEMTTIDRWMLSRLQGVIAACREAYAAYDFRRVFQTLNQFVTVDVSALYVDITKDRMYCDATDSLRRLATRAVMHSVAEALCGLLAPVLAFTADEAWEYLGHQTSVHTGSFPEPDESLIDKALEERMQKLLELRAVIAQAVEPARQAKQIGNALEASVTLQVAGESAAAGIDPGELDEFFILSELTLVSGAETWATIEPVAHKKCARCWRHRPSVGADAAHAELCDRCASVVGK
jgi:isoleucyl-tRNA synthetase